MTAGETPEDAAWRRAVEMACGRDVCWKLGGHDGPCEPGGRPHPDDERTSMSTEHDAFTTAARAEAERQYSTRATTESRMALRSAHGVGAEWARDHLARQEVTDAEVDAAAEAWQAHSRLARPVEGTEPSCEGCGYAFGWIGINEAEERKRSREHPAWAALTAAKKARA